MPQAPPDVEPVIVRGDLTQAQLERYLRGRDLAVDTETLGLYPIRDRLCVVQLCDRERNATLVQVPRAAPGEKLSAPRLKRLLESPDVLKVFHFARFDLAALWHYLDIDVAPVYCTRTASKLVRTYTQRHGLKDVALELLDVEMDKTARSTDWAADELRPEQVRYAISDVTVLLDMMDRLQLMVEREGRAALAEECFRAIRVHSRLDLLGYELLFEH